MNLAEATKDSPLLAEQSAGIATPHKSSLLSGSFYTSVRLRTEEYRPEEKRVQNIIKALDNKGRWLSKHANTSNPYIGDATKTEATDKYASTRAGDETDTSPYPDRSNQYYISTRTFISNMYMLLTYVKEN